MFISWKLVNGLNKMEKRISLWVKFKEKRVFPQLEKLFILRLICTNVVFNWRKRDFSAAKENVDSPVILNQCGI